MARLLRLDDAEILLGRRRWIDRLVVWSGEVVSVAEVALQHLAEVTLRLFAMCRPNVSSVSPRDISGSPRNISQNSIRGARCENTQGGSTKSITHRTLGGGMLLVSFANPARALRTLAGHLLQGS